ncbi:hypothetical protein ABN034_28160 [Actinopolymorpha sp. B11F2]|uniref:hypothetical protein n=1 Tax=Actinopolymorpha sp. B11F2 TaxID=3160862 RepID=UPI0032E373EB
MPALLAGVAGPDHTMPGTLGYSLVMLVGAGSIVATAMWWKHADYDRQLRVRAYGPANPTTAGKPTAVIAASTEPIAHPLVAHCR